MINHPQTAALIELAKKLEHDDPKQAEQRYRQALETATRFYGRLDPQTGIVALELMTFYKKNGNEEEAAKLWDLVRSICMANHPAPSEP